MGRAYEVRKASIQKTGAAKSKLYSMYAREIYQIAKNGGTEVESNSSLKRIIERAKSEQVPADIIKRAIDKVNSGADESYDSVRYEVFGPGGSTLVVDCLTDNVNRSVSDLRTALNKCHAKMGAMGSITYNYDNLCIVGFKGLNEEEALDTLVLKGIDVEDIETNDDMVFVYGKPQDLYQIKEALLEVKSDLTFEIDEISMLPKEKIVLTGEDLEIFNRLNTMIEDIDDVKQVYHNVEL